MDIYTKAVLCLVSGEQGKGSETTLSVTHLWKLWLNYFVLLKKKISALKDNI